VGEVVWLDLGPDPLHDREIWLPGDTSKQAMIKGNGHTDEFTAGQTNAALIPGVEKFDAVNGTTAVLVVAVVSKARQTG
jgi:hypothetical protein